MTDTSPPLARATQEMIDRLVVMLATGVSPQAAERVAVDEKEFGLSPRAARAAVRRAQDAIVRAANYDRAKEVGTAYCRLNDLYARAIELNDVQAALAAQRELDKLLQLHNAPPAIDAGGDVSGSEAAAELAAIRGHLLPLNLCPPDVPLSEHARVAAERLIG